VPETIQDKPHLIPEPRARRSALDGAALVGPYRSGGLGGLTRAKGTYSGRRRRLSAEMQQLIEGLALANPAPSVTPMYRRVGTFLRDVMRRNMSMFRVFSPDENASSRLQDVYDTSLKTWMATIIPDDADGTDIAPDARLSVLLCSRRPSNPGSW
jgi:D-xylulose 5-phosphate/D-fructose 6-phosphate phosphoketolase